MLFYPGKEAFISLLNPESDTPLPFYRTTWFIVLTLLFFSPVGLILMWTADEWETKTKIIVTVVVVIIAILWFLSKG